MKVFLAGTSFRPEYGGPAYSVSRLATALAEAGVRVALWAPDGSAAVTPLVPPTSSIRRMGGTAASAMRAFSKPDILHDNGIWLAHNHRLANLAAEYAIPRVVSTRGMLEPWAFDHKRWKKTVAWALYQRNDLAAAQCHHGTAEAEIGNLRRLRLGVPVHLIPNGVDLPQTDRRSCRLEGKCDRLKTALFLGRIYPVKGLPMLVEAWARLRPKQWKLSIVGPDEAGHRIEVERAIFAAGLGDVISFDGPVYGDAKDSAFSAADLFILPSYSESFGVVVGEALAHGLPVLTTNAVPWPMLTESRCGWRVDTSVDGLAQGLSEATSCDCKTLHMMGARGRDLIERDYGWNRIANQFLMIYEGLQR